MNLPVLCSQVILNAENAYLDINIKIYLCAIKI